MTAHQNVSVDGRTLTLDALKAVAEGRARVALAPEAADMPNLFDIVMNSMQILQYELGNFKAISADVLINPDLSDFTWVEYYRSQELIDRGIEAAEKAMPAIQRVLNQKMGIYMKQG